MSAIRAITPFMWRVIAFVGLFVLISGAAGPRIIASDIFFSAGFGVYGSVGKALIFGLVALVLLVRTKPQAAIAPWRPALLGWGVASVIAFIASWIAVGGLIAGQSTPLNLALAHGGLLLSVAFAGLACFGTRNLRMLYNVYKRELLIAAGIAAAFWVFLTAVYALWQPIATVVMYSVDFLLQLTGLTTAVIPPNQLLLDKFGITVAESCSGIESIALFTGLYIIVGLLDWPRLRRTRYFVVFPIALFLLMVFNILRVYGLIVAGYFINAEIAFTLFHTYAGLVFFMIYSGLFWAIAYKHLVQPHKKEEHAKTA